MPHKHMDVLVIRIYSQSDNLTDILELLNKQGLKVIVNSNAKNGERCEEIIVYREVELEKQM